MKRIKKPNRSVSSKPREQLVGMPKRVIGAPSPVRDLVGTPKRVVGAPSPVRDLVGMPKRAVGSKPRARDVIDFPGTGDILRARDLIEIHVVQADTAWVHTHGLQDFGLAELEIRDVPRFLGMLAGRLLNDVADYMLNPERPVLVNDLIEIDDMGFVQVVPAVPQQGLIPGHYDHERWTVIDAPLSLCRCETCEAKARAYGWN